VARVVLEFYGTLIAYSVIAFVFYCLGMYEFPKDWGLFYLGWFFFFVFSMAVGLIIGSLTEMYDWMEKLVGPFMYFMLPVCGAFYMVDWLPYRLQHYALYIPTVSAFEIIRSGQFGPSVRVHYDIVYEAYACATLVVLGLILCRNVHRHLVIE
jgi:capsular polysaccharide transport system permease protein